MKRILRWIFTWKKYRQIEEFDITHFSHGMINGVGGYPRKTSWVKEIYICGKRIYKSVTPIDK